MSLTDMSKQKWFGRVLIRLGFSTNKESGFDWSDKNLIKKFLKQENLTIGDFNNILKWEAATQVARENALKFWKKENLTHIPPVGKYWSYGYTVNLDKYTTEISQFDPTEYGEVELLGYQNELELMRLALARENQNNVLLFGDAGVGKRSIIHYLAKLIKRENVDSELIDKRVMLIDIGDVVSSIVNKGGNAEHALHSIFQEAARADNVILAINQIGKYLGTQKGSSSINIAAIINEYLALPSFQVIVTSSRSSYHKIAREHEHILKNFESIEVKEPSEENTLKILLQKFEQEERSQVFFTYSALKEIISKSAQLGTVSPLPERAIDLAAEALMYIQKHDIEIVTPEIISVILSLKTGVEHGEIKKDERDKLLNLEEVLHQRVIGQEGAISQVSDAIRRMRAGVRDEKKPVGSFLFLGPTGVGKTETAKALAEAYYGHEKKMIRFDMSEYQAPMSINRLIGSASENRPGLLTSKVREHPFSLILLDELEKAHPDILNLFLQVLDEGFLTDAFGKRVSFRGNIIIATSNAGAPLIKKAIEQGRTANEVRKALIDHIVERGIYRIEFLNRFDDVIFFKSLTSEQLRKVVALMLNNFARDLSENKNISIKFQPGAVDEIIKKGYDPVFGARSVRRYISDRIEDLIARKIIAEETKRGDKLVIGEEELK